MNRRRIERYCLTVLSFFQTGEVGSLTNATEIEFSTARGVAARRAIFMMSGEIATDET